MDLSTCSMRMTTTTACLSGWTMTVFQRVKIGRVELLGVVVGVFKLVNCN